MRAHRDLSWFLAAGVLGASLAACDKGNDPPPGNLPPVAIAQQLATPEDVALEAALSAEDPEGDPLVFSIVEPPLHGALTLTDAGTGSFTYQPAADYFGQDGFSFRVTDGVLESAPALVTVNVTSVNDPPSAMSASIGTGPYGTDATIVVTAAGWRDVENDPEGYVYEWYVNGTRVAGVATASLEGAHFSKHDSVYAVVTPFDGQALGLPVTSDAVTIVNTPPSIETVDLGTGPFYTDAVLTAVPGGWFDADGDAESYVWRWYVGVSRVSGATGPSLDGVYFARGDEVRIEVEANDGEQPGNTVSATVTIANSPPVVTAARLVAQDYRTDDTVSLDLASMAADDADTAESGDTVAYGYRWLVNGAVVPAQTGTTLNGTFFVKGDTVACEVTPSDGSADGAPFTTSAATIGNTPPTIAGASIAPGTYFTDSTISAVPSGWADADPGDSAGPYRHEWYVDDVLVPGAAGATLEGSYFAKHQRVFALVFPSDGTDEGAGARTNEVTISNSVPAATAGVFHGFAGLTTGGTLAGTDADNDALGFAKDADSPDGTVTVESTGTLTFDPAPGFMGTTSFTFTVSDGEGARSAPAVATIVVERASLVGVGSDGGCAIKAADHSLWCWGDNGSGEVGDGTTTLRASPVREARGFADWAFLDVGGDAACAIRADRSLWCWGKNVAGTAGVGNWEPVNQPTQVGTERDWVRVSVGQAHACGIRQDESLWCWGLNTDGQVGDDSLVNRNTPQLIGSGYMEVGLGSTMSCAVKTDGRLFCWGSNVDGRLGNGSSLSSRVPVQEWLQATNWRYVFGGGSSNHTCAVNTFGHLHCWGKNGSPPRLMGREPHVT